MGINAFSLNLPAITVGQFLDPTAPGFLLGVLLLSLLAAGLILWRRLQSRRQLMARVAELEALNDAGRAIVAAQLNVAALVELIVVEFGKVIDNRTFQIGLFEGDYYRIVAWYIEGKRQDSRTFDLSEHEGLVGWVRANRQPLLVRDFPNEMAQLPARPRYVSDQPPRSALFLPLISGDAVIGIVAAQSAEPNRFNKGDARRLSILANQTAAAIVNARLFEQEKHRSAQLELVGQVAQQVNQLDDLEEIFRQVVALVPQTFGYHPINIFRIDNETGEAVLQASSVAELGAGMIRLPAGAGLVGAAVAQRATVVANQARSDSRFVPQVQGLPDEFQPQTAAEVVIPMLVREELLGILDVQSERENAFDGESRMVLEALGAQVGTAIFRARQMALQREQAWFTAAQFQVADAISRSAEMEEMLESVTRLSAMLVGLDECGVLLWDRDRHAYVGRALSGAPRSVDERFAAEPIEIGAWGPLDAVHVGQEMLVTDRMPPWGGRDGARIRVLLPLVSRATLQGVLFVALSPSAASNGAGLPALSGRQGELLRDIANQIAAAVERNALNLAQQEEAWVNTALFQVAEAISSLIDLHEILDTIVRFVPMLVGVRSCLVLIWDELHGHFRAGPSYGISAMGRGLLEASEIEQEEFVSVVPQQEDERAPGVTSYAVRLPRWMERALDSDEAQAFSLIARGQLVGIFLVGPTHNGQPLQGRRLSIMTGITHQAAIAVVNDQLYRESAQREKMEKELDVARNIQRSLIPSGSPAIPRTSVASYWQAARQVSGDFYDFLALADGRWGIVIADVADKGVPAALFMALSRTIVRTIAYNSSSPAETLMRVNELICSDNQSDLFVTMFYAIWDPRFDTLIFANGGHNPPLLLREEGDVEELRTDGIALGVLPGARISENYVRLYPGDAVVLYTDGVTEAMNEDFDEFGLERLRLAGQAMLRLDATDILDGIIDAVEDHAGQTAQFDDITLVVFKRAEES